MDGKRASVAGTVAMVVFQNEENGYTVLKLRSDEGSVVCVGCLPGVCVGERLVLTGSWTSHHSYGEQFKVDSAERYLPDTSETIFEYLASGAVKGIGVKTARLIVDRFGERSLRVLEESPEELSEIKGLTRRRAEEIVQRFREQTGLRRLMEFLALHRVKPYVAVRLYRRLGESALEELSRNPYLLTEEEYGLDFFEADALAMEMGLPPDSPQRAAAAVLFEMRHNLGNGHVFLPREKLVAAAKQITGLGEDNIDRALEDLSDGEYIYRERIAGEDSCYLEEMYLAETYTARRLLVMAAQDAPCVPELEQMVSRAGRACGIEFARKQREALRAAAESFLLVLTGGPGTGKTTTVRGILSLFDEMGFKTLLTAPTGRAAKRLSELTGRSAFTVHRLLGASAPGGGEGEREFEKCAADPLKCDAVIIDEMSMMDISLTAALLDAMPPTARLVMVGDADQLPSVGPGNVFSDIIRSGIAPVVELTEIFRQARQSAIVRAAHEINNGTLPQLKNSDGDFFFLRRAEPEWITGTVTELVSRRLPENMGIPAREIQVLAPSRKNEAGTAELNRALQAAINPQAQGKSQRTVGETVFRVGDRVMQTRNNYDAVWYRLPEGVLPGEDEDLEDRTGTGLYNGDIGYIESIDPGRETAFIRFEDRLSPYPFEDMQDLEMAYAVTVHKSQGSEYRAVVLALPRTAPGLATRGLLYTAVTRARELLVVVGDTETFEAMTKSERRQRRYSGLRARLCAGAGEAR